MNNELDAELFYQHHRLIDLLRYYKDIEKTNIAKKMDVSMPTLYKALDDLKKARIIDPDTNRINKDKITLVGISIGSAQTKLVFAHTDFSLFSEIEFEEYKVQITSALKERDIQVQENEIQTEMQFDHIFFSTPDEFSQLKDALDIIFHCLLSFKEKEQLNIASIGISCTGIINTSEQKILQSHNLKYLDETTLENLIFPDKQEKFNKMDIDICLLQNSNAAVVAEKVFLYETNSIYKDRKNIVSIYLGVGIGAGFIIDNKFFVGTNGFAGEIGHISSPNLPEKEYDTKHDISTEENKSSSKDSSITHDHDDKCTCGREDCYDLVIRKKAFLSDANKMAEKSSSSIEKQLNEDKEAARILGFYLGNIVNMLTSLLNVDLIVFTGKIARSMPLLYNQIAKIQDNNPLKFSRNDCAIVKSEYGALSPAVGAAIYSYYHKYNIECKW